MIDNSQTKTNPVNKILMITIIINIVLIITKMLAGWISNSTALIADGLHSGTDIITSLGIIIGVSMSRKPRDECHNYGHEKIETITTFLLSLVIIYVGFRIGLSSISSMLHTEIVIFNYFSLGVALTSVIIKEILYQATYSIGKREKCAALMADAWHHRSDALASIASVIGIIGAKYGIYILDSIGGFVVSIIVINVGAKIFIDSFHQLSDSSIHVDEIEHVTNIILKETSVLEIGDFRSRKHGSKIFVDIRIFVNSTIEVQEGHAIADTVESIIRREIHDVNDVLVHVDPHIQ